MWAFDYKTGAKRWAVGNREAGYSSPHFAVLDKVPQILVFDAEALGSFDPKTGKELWSVPWKNDIKTNMAQPLVIGGDKVFISSEVKNGCTLFQVIAPGKDAVNWRVCAGLEEQEPRRSLRQPGDGRPAHLSACKI